MIKKLSKGYLVVASRKPNFYSLAINCIESIKDYYPDAKCCLVTEEKFLDGREDIADDLIFCDDHYRAKLWGMANSPYDITMYIDADSEIEHEDIAIVFDELNDNDLMFHKLDKKYKKVYATLDFTYENVKEYYTYCGGVCLYDMRNPLIKDFMNDWNDLFRKQYSKELILPMNPWQDLWNFDQTTLWYLLNKVDKYKNIKVDSFKDNLRWNYFPHYERFFNDFPKDPIVIRHYSSYAEKDKSYA